MMSGSLSPRVYQYVGPAEIAVATSRLAPGDALPDAVALRQWLQGQRKAFDRQGNVVLTFVVGTDGVLRVADRHSEHVACAGGGPVRAAGEMTLTLAGDRLAVEAVTNQSTGYCTQPDSWAAVSAALEAAGLRAPECYTTAFEFRRCKGCGQIHLLKDGDDSCGVCGAELPADWNLAP